MDKTRREGTTSGNKYRRSEESVKEKGVTCRHKLKGVDSSSRALTLYKKYSRKAQHDLFQGMHTKLQMLEEEMSLMKKTIVGCVEERAMLIDEITQQLHRTKKSLVCLEAGDCYQDGDRKMGLLGVLQKNAAPPCIIKDMKVNLNTFQDLISTS